MLVGSEGILGVVTEAWMRVRPRPVFKASAVVEFDDFAAAATGAVRAIVQSRLGPSNCRLIDPMEAGTMGAGDGSATLLLLGFESADVPVGELLDQAIAIATDHGGRVTNQSVKGPDSEGGGRRRQLATSGRTPSCSLRTSATPSSPAASFPRPSRPRSPGTGSRTSTGT